MTVTDAATIAAVEARADVPAKNAEGWDFNFDADDDVEPLPLVTLSATDLAAAVARAASFYAEAAAVLR